MKESNQGEPLPRSCCPLLQSKARQGNTFTCLSLPPFTGSRKPFPSFATIKHMSISIYR